jgi:PhoPQ-activated pathogenicity-related protein
MRSRIPTAIGACLIASTLALWARPDAGSWIGGPDAVVHAQAALARPGPGAKPAPAVKPAAETALDRYVNTPDPAFRFSVVATRPGEGHTAYLLEVVSQRWLTTADVDKPEWRHWLTIIKPDTVAHATGFLLVAGGDTKRKPPDRTDAGLLDIAMTTKSVVAELRMVPNQPLVFANDGGRERSEDEIIAYTWDKFLRTGDERWPARLPMTKAVVRAMDAITAFCASPAAGSAAAIDTFVVAGASKRGWTSWITAAVDRRVVAVVPIVIDVLNVEPSFDHHYRAYGFYAPSVKDYEESGLMDWLGTPQYRALMRIEDPYEYRDRLTMPKFLVNATGDQFFLPDSWTFYLRDLPGETHVRYVPNADHSLRGTDALSSVAAFYGAILTGTPRPAMTWEATPDGRIRVRSTSAPSSVTAWRATNPAARDFRLETLGPVWESTKLEPVSPGVWETTIASPVVGWSAGLIEMRFPSGSKYPFVFTSGVAVVPDRLPNPSPRRTGRVPAAAPTPQKR